MPPILRQQLQGFRAAHRAHVKPEKVRFFEFKIYEAIIEAATAGHCYYNCPVQLDSEVSHMDDERLPEYCINEVIALLYQRFPDCTIRYITPGLSNKKDWRTTLGHKAYLQVIWG